MYFVCMVILDYYVSQMHDKIALDVCKCTIWDTPNVYTFNVVDGYPFHVLLTFASLL